MSRQNQTVDGDHTSGAQLKLIKNQINFSCTRDVESNTYRRYSSPYRGGTVQSARPYSTKYPVPWGILHANNARERAGVLHLNCSVTVNSLS